MNISPVVKAETASDLRLDVFKISLSLCIYPIVSTFLSNTFLTIFSVMSGITGKGLTKAFMRSDFYPYYQVAITLIPLLLCFAVVCLLTGHKLTSFSLKPQVKAKTFTAALTVGTIIVPLGMATSAITQKVLSIIGANTHQINIPKGTLATVLFILAHVIIAPLLEELIFRFVILERFRRYGDLFAIISSSLLFALLHSSFQSYLPSFVSGVILSIVAIYTGSALCSIILHVINNGLSVVMLLLSRSLPSAVCDLVYIAIAGALFIVAICTLLFMYKNNNDLFDLQFKEKVLSTKRKASLLLFSFSSLVFIVFSLSMAISSAFL